MINRILLTLSLIFVTPIFGETLEDECIRHIEDGRYTTTVLNKLRIETNHGYSLLRDAFVHFSKASEVCKGKDRELAIESATYISYVLEFRCRELLHLGETTMLSLDSKNTPNEVTYMMLYEAVNYYRDAETICIPHTKELEDAIKYSKLVNDAFIDWEKQLISLKVK